MIRQIEEIDIALKAGAYYAALALALTLPDICAQVEYKKRHTGNEDYIGWLKGNNVLARFESCFPEVARATFCAEDCYALRCRVLHNGDLNLSESKRSEIDAFELALPEEGEDYLWHYYVGADERGRGIGVARINIVGLTRILRDAAMRFYDNWPDKRAFDDHNLRIATGSFDRTIRAAKSAT